MKTLNFSFFALLTLSNKESSHLADSHVTTQYPKEKYLELAFASRVHLMIHL